MIVVITSKQLKLFVSVFAHFFCEKLILMVVRNYKQTTINEN